MEKQQEYEFYAFISYNSRDVKWAKWLQKRLENYSLPVTLQKNHGVPKHLSPVFRDGTGILPKELKSELHTELEKSRYLIVLCSPQSASSEWVGYEIDQFCRMGRKDRVIALIIDGEPYSGNALSECYHPKLRQWFPKGATVDTDSQLLGADIHAAGPESGRFKRERAFMQVVAVMLSLPFDTLWNRRRRKMVAEIAVSLLLFFSAVSSVAAAWTAGLPFDVDVRLVEMTPHNDALPFGDGILTMVSGDDTLGVRPVKSLDESVVFSNIPGKFRGSDADILFDMYGFVQSDTVVSLSSHHIVQIGRNGEFSVFAGYIVGEDGFSPVQDVEVRIAGCISSTDSSGYFHIEFPIEEQSKIKHVTLSKQGFVTGEYDLQPQSDHLLPIFKK